MSIKIGDNAKIKNSSIGHKLTIETDNKGNKKESSKKDFFSRHPLISYIVIPMMIAFIFLFNFWESLVHWIEGIFK